MSRTNMFGFENRDWKPWVFNGLEVLVADGFRTAVEPEKGGLLIYPKGDVSAPPCAHMPKDGFFFDSIIRQKPVDMNNLDPADNAEQYQPLTEAQLDGVEARHVIKPEARSHPDAEAVPPMVTYHCNGLDFVPRKPIGPQSRSEIPPQFLPVHLDGQGGEHDRSGDEGDQHNCRRPLPAPPDGRRSEHSRGQANDHNQNPTLRMTVGHSHDPPSRKRGESELSAFHLGKLVAGRGTGVHSEPGIQGLREFAKDLGPREGLDAEP